MNQSSLSWLEALLRDLAAGTPGLASWDLSLWEGGVRVDLGTEPPVRLDLHARIDGEAYAHTASISMFARVDGAMSPSAQAVTAAFVDAVAQADDGALILPKGASIHVDAPQDRPDDVPLTLQDVLAWRDAAEAYREQLHVYSYVALKSILTDDLYPHVMSLGEPVAESDIQASWRQVNRLMTEGRAPNKLGIYVHIPYCTVECAFCYCGKTEEFGKDDVDSYVLNLLDELNTYADFVDGQPITSIYFGGGTPSLLTPPAMRRIFTDLYDRFDVPEGTQVIFEGNPDSLKPHKVEILGTLGRVTRLTMGIQTLDPEVQKWVRRFNKKEDVEAAIRAAKAIGIPHVNFDCIAGLPSQSMQSWQRDIDYLLSLEPDSIHLNGFRPLPRTIYAQKGAALEPEQERLRDEMLAWAEERLAEAGFGATLEQGPHRTRNAANIQEYDLRTQNSSLLGLGYPSRSHAFAGWYYIRDTQLGDGSFVGALREQNKGERIYRGVPADHREEMHKYVVTNIRGGFQRQEFRDLFGIDAVDAMPAGFKALEELGAVAYIDDKVKFRTGRSIDALVYRSFFYSDAMRERVFAAWGDGYDKDEDYLAHLEYLVPPAD